MAQENDYDEVEEIQMNEETKNPSNRDSGSVYEKELVQNPYYGGEEDATADESSMKVGYNYCGTKMTATENPYYGGMEEETDHVVMNVEENPYYGGVNDEN